MAAQTWNPGSLPFKCFSSAGLLQKVVEGQVTDPKSPHLLGNLLRVDRRQPL